MFLEDEFLNQFSMKADTAMQESGKSMENTSEWTSLFLQL